jgi:hypothetical protein
LKEKKVATELIAVTIGPKAAQDSIRTAMAMGIDRGIHIETNLRPDQELQPLAVAKLLKAIVQVSFSVFFKVFFHTLFQFYSSLERRCKISDYW